MSEPPGGLPQDAPLPAHLDPRGRRSAPVPRPSRSRRRTLRRVLGGALVVLLVLLLGTLGSLAFFDRRIDRVPVASVGAGADVDGGDRNYLLVGSDSRDGLTEQELAEVRTTAKDRGATGSLTDTVVLLHVPAGGGTPTLVSFPRDSFVEIPGYGRGRINTAYALGERSDPGSGPATLVSTVQQLSGLQIDGYMEIGFIAFLRLTDALGGVEVNLCGAVREPDSGIDLPAGRQRLDGSDALAFVRQRKGLPRGDLDRVARQQYFLAQAARQVLTPSTLLRPDRALRLLSAVSSSVTVDENLSTFDLARLALRLRGAASGGLAFATVPVADADARRGGASVVLLDEAALPGFFAGLSPADQPEQAAPPAVTVAPEAIRLEVRNGTSRAGLAGTAADDLAARGFTVTRTGNADRQDTTASVVLHGADRADSARTVAASVPGAVVRQDDTLGAGGLVLVVGENYRGAQAVTVAPTAGPPTAGPPTAEPDAGASPGGGAPAAAGPTLPCIT